MFFQNNPALQHLSWQSSKRTTEGITLESNADLLVRVCGSDPVEGGIML